MEKQPVFLWIMSNGNTVNQPCEPCFKNEGKLKAKKTGMYLFIFKKSSTAVCSILKIMICRSHDFRTDTHQQDSSSKKIK